MARTDTDQQAREADLLGTTVAYEVRYSEDATEPRIDVDIRGVHVVLPADSDAEPDTILTENTAWVVEKHRKYEQYRESVPDRTFEEGETFPYLDEPHEIVVEQRPSSAVVDGTFRLAEHQVAQTSVRRALETLYRRKARERFEDRADHFAAEMGVEYAEIEVRNQRTRWGSCSTSGTLGLNWRLMMAPPEIIDYIMIHELAHLRVSAHSDEFWSLVGECAPNYQRHIEWLEKQSTRLVFSVEDL